MEKTKTVLISAKIEDIDYILNRFVNILRKRQYHLQEIIAQWWEDAYIKAVVVINESMDKEQVENQIKKIYGIKDLTVNYQD